MGQNDYFLRTVLEQEENTQRIGAPMLEAEIPGSGSRTGTLTRIPHYQYRRVLNQIISAYDSPVIRAYSKIRFSIININILDILALCLRGKRKVLDIGCGFGLFGCYLSALKPHMKYYGIDINEKRVSLARLAATRLGLENARFECKDARSLSLDDQYDAIIMIDLLHHVDNAAKRRLLETCSNHLVSNGSLAIKDVTTHPALELAFTWALDVAMTRSFDMWYLDENRFLSVLGEYFNRIDTYPIQDWMPYPHIVYLCEQPKTVIERPQTHSWHEAHANLAHGVQAGEAGHFEP